MIRHKFTIAGEDLSEYLISAHIEKFGDIDYADANAEFVLANVYGKFTGKWRDEGSEEAKVGLILQNERNTCLNLPGIREPGEHEAIIETETKEYHAFCGYIQRVDYDEEYVKIRARTAQDFLEQEPMPDGVKPKGGTAYIAWPPAEIILDVISQHKDPPIEAAMVDSSSPPKYPTLRVPMTKIPGFKPPLPTPPLPKPPDGKDGTGGGEDGGGGGEPKETCPVECRYKQLNKTCKSVECPYKFVNMLCRQVSCPYNDVKIEKCFGKCPYDTARTFGVCPACGGSGHSPRQASICSACNGTGKFIADDVKSTLSKTLSEVENLAQQIKSLNAEMATERDPAKRAKLKEELQKVQLLYKLTQNKLKEIMDNPVTPIEKSTDIAKGMVKEAMVNVDFWNPPLIKDQVQGVKGVKYADVIRLIERQTGGTFYIDEYCKARFIPPGWIRPTPDNMIDISHLVTKQGLGKNAMGHANIVVVYGSGITDPGRSPVERERHKVVGYLEENVDSIRKHGTVHSAEEDIHYLPKDEQVKQLAKNLINYYKTEADKAVTEAIGISPYIFQKIRWKIPIGPLANSRECEAASEALLAVVEGRVNRVILDYSVNTGWICEINASTEEDVAANEENAALPDSKDGIKYNVHGMYLFAPPDVYNKLRAQAESDIQKSTMSGGEGFYFRGDEFFTPTSGDHLFAIPTETNDDKVTLYSRSGIRGQEFGKSHEKPDNAFMLRALPREYLNNSYKLTLDEKLRLSSV